MLFYLAFYLGLFPNKIRPRPPYPLLQQISRKMSSPLNSLRKNKVPLFPGHMSGNRPIPFRHPEYSEDESKLLEEITTAMVMERRKKDQSLTLPSLAASQSNSSFQNQSGDKVPSMLKRFGGGIATLPGVVASAETGTSTDGRDSVSPREPPSDKELMRLMMNRIAVLEQAVRTAFRVKREGAVIDIQEFVFLN